MIPAPTALAAHLIGLGMGAATIVGLLPAVMRLVQVLIQFPQEAAWTSCPGRDAKRSIASQSRGRLGGGVRYGPGSARQRFTLQRVRDE